MLGVPELATALGGVSRQCSEGTESPPSTHWSQSHCFRGSSGCAKKYHLLGTVVPEMLPYGGEGEKEKEK